MDLHELHDLIAERKPRFTSVSDLLANQALFMGQGYSFVPAACPEQYGMLMPGTGSEVGLPPPPPPATECFEFSGGGGGGGGQGRWPRQETLTLLEVRSRLDSSFREAARRGPLWDEVSRIMAEEHGYQRSGKKCREKLENLYKYYKKTKEGKAGRQDGKHYRFCRQLEALYGESSNIVATEINRRCSDHATNAAATLPAADRGACKAPKLSWSISLSSSGECNEASSTEEEGDGSTGRLVKTGGESWKSKVEEFIGAQIKRLMEAQATWMNQMLKTLEHMELARISREEDWRREEAARLDRERILRAGERAWSEARDAVIVQALEKMSRRELKPRPREETNGNIWTDDNSMAPRWPSREGRRGGGGLGVEVPAAVACVGCSSDSTKRCKEKWDECLRKGTVTNKRPRKSGAMDEDIDGCCSGWHEDGRQGSDVVGLQLTDARWY
ncbi:trihelix transcription factor PTL-like [Musa acuminata AAA Group]|uniref:trihelix transcription factor PTL-like n=1 Tax=Musa acuminata AAA Group TaxID=214697 RepID=UPI0031E28C2E